PQNQPIFSVIREDEKVDAVISLLQEICGNLEDPATGIVVKVPVNQVVSLAPELGPDAAAGDQSRLPADGRTTVVSRVGPGMRHARPGADERTQGARQPSSEDETWRARTR